MYKLCVYVPETHLEVVKQALFDAGAGRIGAYDSCCWQVAGQGQFRPLAGSNPFLGAQNQIETVLEYKVELVCEDHLIRDVVNNMKRAHPYEEPAYQVWRLEDF
jgi:hypothetical protein